MVAAQGMFKDRALELLSRPGGGVQTSGPDRRRLCKSVRGTRLYYNYLIESSKLSAGGRRCTGRLTKCPQSPKQSMLARLCRIEENLGARRA
jgi:hypothetical protein